MATKIVQEIASEITTGLLSIFPGSSVVMKMLPATGKSTIRKLFGLDQAKTLQSSIEDILEATTANLLDSAGAVRGSHEYGATFHAMEDFKKALQLTPLTTQIVLDALVDSETLRQRLRDNCPVEHQKWASDLRRNTFETVLIEFTETLIAIAPQVPSVQTAINIETYRLVAGIQMKSSRDDANSPKTVSP